MQIFCIGLVEGQQCVIKSCRSQNISSQQRLCGKFLTIIKHFIETSIYYMINTLKMMVSNHYIPFMILKHLTFEFQALPTKIGNRKQKSVFPSQMKWSKTVTEKIYYSVICQVSEVTSKVWNIPKAQINLKFESKFEISSEIKLTKYSSGWNRLSVQPEGHLGQDDGHDARQVRLNHKITDLPLQVEVGCHHSVLTWVGKKVQNKIKIGFVE